MHLFSLLDSSFFFVPSCEIDSFTQEAATSCNMLALLDTILFRTKPRSHEGSLVLVLALAFHLMSYV